MSLMERIRPELRGLLPYSAAEQVDQTIRLNANESPFTAPTDNFRRPLNRYPRIRPETIRDRLASRFGCSDDELLVTRGSSEAIDLLFRAFCIAGKNNVVISTPTFSMYAHYAHIQNASVRDVALNPDFQPDVDALRSAIDADTSLVFVCSPNNPTGTSSEPETIEAILAAAGPKTAVIVDEAYIEFSGRPSLASALSRHSNLIVLRTLSKALGFAGARCGAVIASPDVIGVLNAIQAPYAVSTPVIEAVEDALSEDSLAVCDANVYALVQERERVRAALEEMSFVTRIWPSDANFLLVEFDDVPKIMDTTRQSGILLRFFGGDLARCIRISIGSFDENERLLATLRRLESTQ